MNEFTEAITPENTGQDTQQFSESEELEKAFCEAEETPENAPPQEEEPSPAEETCAEAEGWNIPSMLGLLAGLLLVILGVRRLRTKN